MVLRKYVLGYPYLRKVVLKRIVPSLDSWTSMLGDLLGVTLQKVSLFTSVTETFLEICPDVP